MTAEGRTTTAGRKICRVTLETDERTRLQAIIDSGKGSRERRKRAPVLLLADTDRTGGSRRDAAIADVLGVGTATVERVRTPCVLDGLEAALERTVPVNRTPRRRDGAGAATLTMRACSAPPAGPAQWTLPRRADRLVALKVVDTLARSTVPTTLKKTVASPGGAHAGASRPGRVPILWMPWRMGSPPTRVTSPLMTCGSALLSHQGRPARHQR